MAYKVQLTEDAEQDFERYVRYLLLIKKNEQAARNLISDFEATKKSLEQVAESLKYCDNSRLSQQGYRRINFLSHRYFMMYRVENEIVIVDNIFHELQDFERKVN